MRRIRSVAFSIPCVVGPYASVNCAASLQSSTVRYSPLVGEGYARDGADALRFVDRFGGIQSVVTIRGTNDNGLFESSAGDDRLLPFEGCGVIGAWRLELPRELRQFDYETISDVIRGVILPAFAPLSEEPLLFIRRRPWRRQTGPVGGRMSRTTSVSLPSSLMGLACPASAAHMPGRSRSTATQGTSVGGSMKRAAVVLVTAVVVSGLCATPAPAATIFLSGTDGTAGTNEIQFRRPPGHPGQGASSDGDLTSLTTDFGAGPLTLQRDGMNDEPARLGWASGMIQTIDESDPLTTYVGFAGGSSLSVTGAAFGLGPMPIAEGILFSGDFPLGMDVLTFALNEPCLYPSVCTGTISGPILAGGLLDAALAAALGVSPVILGGFFSLSADNLVYDAATGEVEGVVTTKLIELQVEEVPAPPAATLLLVSLGFAYLRRACKTPVGRDR